MRRVQDLMMEIERIKALEQYEAREQQRNEERRRGAKVLEEQISQREYERLRQVRAVAGCVCMQCHTYSGGRLHAHVQAVQRSRTFQLKIVGLDAPELEVK